MPTHVRLRPLARTGLHGRGAQHKVGWDGPVRRAVQGKLVTDGCTANTKKTNAVICYITGTSTLNLQQTLMRTQHDEPLELVWRERVAVQAGDALQRLELDARTDAQAPELRHMPFVTDLRARPVPSIGLWSSVRPRSTRRADLLPR